MATPIKSKESELVYLGANMCEIIEELIYAFNNNVDLNKIIAYDKSIKRRLTRLAYLCHRWKKVY